MANGLRGASLNHDRIVMMGYEILEHTADIRVRVYGESFVDLLKNAALAMLSLITGEGRSGRSKESSIRSRGRRQGRRFS